MTQPKGIEGDKLKALYERAWSDEEFAARLNSDAKSAVAEYLGDLPEDLSLKVVRDSDRVKYLHIPAAPTDGEISEMDLLQVQGGTTPACVSASVVFSVVTVAGSITTLSFLS
ncbi:hypothetical protein Q5Y75_14090 [Ruegeria sp. 2205SS24-7]|uniref:hypothetical protein n=1 Tax=Ruegeria discodermiae TaxID=3064389 RepID=UPI002741396B|nr:hypothetical protein [Ruegeria sp. 2205SS24-7]MDP5218358.1 hypothetical protein [Ruegeria sp. 2205SS24-7]